MHESLTHLLLALFSLFSIVNSAPAMCSTSIGEPGGVYLCSRINLWRDSNPQYDCKWRKPDTSCYNMPTQDAFEMPSSVGPDPGGYCDFYLTRDCVGTPSELPNDEEHFGGSK
jgi:hypothetical protein